MNNNRTTGRFVDGSDGHRRDDRRQRRPPRARHNRPFVASSASRPAARLWILFAVTMSVPVVCNSPGVGERKVGTGTGRGEGRIRDARAVMESLVQPVAAAVWRPVSIPG